MNPHDAVERRKEAQTRNDLGYRAWLDRAATLSTTMLTVLVSFQGNYVPDHPKLPRALATAWIALGIAIVGFLWGSYGESFRGYADVNEVNREKQMTPEQLAEKRSRDRTGRLEEPRPLYGIPTLIAAAALLVGIVAIVAFAIANQKH